jgi:hypothetical protein
VIKLLLLSFNLIIGVNFECLTKYTPKPLFVCVCGGGGGIESIFSPLTVLLDYSSI